MAVLMFLILALGLTEDGDTTALHFAKCKYRPSPEQGFVKWSCQ